MENYEITYLVETAEKSKEVKQLIQSTGATFKETKDWGEREMAYPIGRYKRAFYFTGLIETIPANIQDIKKKLNYSDVAIRYVILSIEK